MPWSRCWWFLCSAVFSCKAVIPPQTELGINTDARFGAWLPERKLSKWLCEEVIKLKVRRNKSGFKVSKGNLLTYVVKVKSNVLGPSMEYRVKQINVMHWYCHSEAWVDEGEGCGGHEGGKWATLVQQQWMPWSSTQLWHLIEQLWVAFWHSRRCN